jgi:hypothetical protein
MRDEQDSRQVWSAAPLLVVGVAQTPGPSEQVIIEKLGRRSAEALETCKAEAE